MSDMTVDEKLAEIFSVMERASSEFKQQLEMARDHRARLERDAAAVQVRGVDRSRELTPVERPFFVRMISA